MLPELGPDLWIGIGFGLFGVAAWLGSLIIMSRVLERIEND